MKTKLVRVLLAVTFTLSLAAAAQGRQTPPSVEAQISQHRSDIQLLLDNAPSPGAPESEVASFRNSLLNLRRGLRDLLLERRGGLKVKLQSLQQSANAAVQGHANVIASELKSVNDEVDALDRALAQSGTAPSAPPAPATDGSGQDKSALTEEEKNVLKEASALVEGAKKERADMRASSAKAVESITDKQLEEAAAPPEVAETQLLTSRCTANGAAFLGPPESPREGSAYDKAVCTLAANIVRGNRQKRVINLTRDSTPLFSILIPKLLKTTGDGSYAAFVTEAQEQRTDQQLGAGPSSSGTTSLVSKGGIPYLFAFAVENGAATQTQSDTSVTFRFNPAGALNLFTKKGFITGFRETEDDALLKFLRKTSVGLTFDTTRGDNAGTFTGDRQQLSEVNVKFEVVNERDPRHRRYQADWERFVANEGVALAGQIWKTTLATVKLSEEDSDAVFVDSALQAWLDKTNESVATAVGTDLEVEARINAVADVIRKQADLLPVEIVSAQTVDAISSFAKQFRIYTERKNELLDEIAKGKVLAFEYTNKREVNAPDTSNFRFIAAKGRDVMGGRMDFTANGSLTLFHKRPAPLTPSGQRSGRLRDFQFAAQADVPFQVGGVGQFVFWFGGRYERLLEDVSTGMGDPVPNTKGDIAVGQFGLKIPIKGLGMQFPISFTFANRTELVKEKEVRGNFGFTLNMDQILSRLMPF